MSKKINRIIAGTLSIMLVGQAMMFGDGSSYGILHAETIRTVCIEVLRNKGKTVMTSYDCMNSCSFLRNLSMKFYIVVLFFALYAVHLIYCYISK